ncbi:hypothetical protein [Spirosoma areae]
MSFKHLQIRYQTARSLPAPYAYFYTLTAEAVGREIQVDLAITYPDRDDIDDDELIAEGYTRDDDFSWSGRLPGAWLDTLTQLVSKTRLQPLDEDALGEDDDFWAIMLDSGGKEPKQGRPQQADDWQYTVQELMQAAYESIGRERPFDLTYLSLSQQNEFNLHLTASFAERSVTVVNIQSGRERTRTLPWASLQRLMRQVYEHEYDPNDAQLKRPKRAGNWLNLGGEEWYDVRPFRKLVSLLNEL